jgi:hypothetical protein
MERVFSGQVSTLRQIGTTGKSHKSLSIPTRKNKPLALSGKSLI